ncbi:hypothetical protein GCK72_011027 [Caenorhabditis remanei]|uniref:Uncharacterized protein n=1 Tax=Caenorhabditis remanei TaxID=31234 RepID=A0A6A5H7J5_CAERE|nr:hypothetical protein GCK72_011027 [Caenorhabditis remanei]KAF1762764.1 hypothetical protein GCK72_011027 [Caenorhabditis remanei]
MSEEVVLELASQQVIKFLLGEQKFIEKWQSETRRNLEENQRRYQDDEGIDLRKPSTSTSSSSHSKTPHPYIISIQTAVIELTSTIQYFIETFEANVDPRNCFISTDRTHQNREVSELFDAGLKVEHLKKLAMENKEERENIAMHIGTACRRVGLVLKTFGKRFQGQPSIEIQCLVPVIHRFCRLFYTISSEILRFSENFRSKNRKLLKSIGKSIEESANEFNLKVLADVETIEKHLKNEEKRKKPQAPPTFHHMPSPVDYGIQTRRQQRLATSIQQVLGRRRDEDSDDVIARFRRPHPPGGIATSIIQKRRGFLMDDNLMKARQRIARIVPKTRDSPRHVTPTLNIDKNSSMTPEDPDDVIMKSAKKLTELVLDDMRKTIKY